ncbi:hypothetical protein [Candidatus Harpocratesius sp.]
MPDQFLEYTKSIWWQREDLLRTSQKTCSIIENLPYSSIIDYFIPFIYLYSFKEDTVIIGISHESLYLQKSLYWAVWQVYFKILREKIIFLKIKH